MTDTLAGFADSMTRIAVGAFLIPHGVTKLRSLMHGAGLPGEEHAFAQIGLRPPRPWIWLATLIQTVGGVLLVLGLFTRPAALAATFMLLGACAWVGRRGWYWGRGGMEYSLFWALMAFAIFCKGGGSYSLDAWVGF